MKRLGTGEFKEGMKVRWRKNGVTRPEVLTVHKIQKSPRGKTSVQFKDSSGQISTNLNPGNRYVPAEV